jgi:DNA-binding MarR family transcriptional regulator
MEATTRVKRSPTSAELRVVRAYIEASERFRSRLGARLAADSGLSHGDYGVLVALSEAKGRRLRSSELASRIDWERSRLSHHLGRMESRGLVRREACATDSRGAEIVLTDEGARQFRRASAPQLRAIQELFVNAFTAEQLAQIEEITTALTAHLERSSLACEND